MYRVIISLNTPKLPLHALAPCHTCASQRHPHTRTTTTAPSDYRHSCCHRLFVFQLYINSSHGQWICTRLSSSETRPNKTHTFIVVRTFYSSFFWLCRRSFRVRPTVSGNSRCPFDHLHEYFGGNRRLKGFCNSHILIYAVFQHNIETTQSSNSRRR